MEEKVCSGGRDQSNLDFVRPSMQTKHLKVIFNK